MQKISFGNRDYVKASEIAKHFKYTQDYVGQLCRGDKVDARLVGRVWYVNLESVKEYRKTKHSTQKKAAKKAIESRKKRKRSPVEPVVRAKTARKIQEAFPHAASGAVKHVSTTYSRDKVSVIPILGSSAEEVSPVLPKSDSKPKVTIKVRPESRKSTKYHAQKLPEITLKAKLKVTDNVENVSEKSTAVDELEAAATKESPVVMESLKPGVTNDPSKPAKEINFEPASVTEKKTTRFSKRTKTRNGSHRATVPTWLLPAVSAVGLVLLALLSFGVSYYAESGDQISRSGLTFELDTVAEKIAEVLK